MRTTRVATIALLMGLFGASLAPSAALAEGGCGWRDRRPYGDYCDGSRWGRYGANDPVKTAKDARERLKQFFEDDDVVVGAITERARYFEAEIQDSDGEIVDRVIIDKRTGRIRSIL